MKGLDDNECTGSPKVKGYDSPKVEGCDSPWVKGCGSTNLNVGAQLRSKAGATDIKYMHTKR